MDRRRIHQAALAWALTTALPARSATDTEADSTKPTAPPPMRRPEDPTFEQLAMGLRMLLEVCTRDALSQRPAPDDILWPQRLRSLWNDGDWLAERLRAEDRSPWMRYEHFEAVAQMAWERCWPQAKTNLMLQVHHLRQLDMQTLLADTQRRPEDGRWATVQLERRAGGQLGSRLLGDVVQVQLDWLRTHTDRYAPNPAARNAQVEMEHFEACQRINRALIDSVFYAIALQEQQWRFTPLETVNVPTHMATVLAVLGPPPDKMPFAIRRRLRPLAADTPALVKELTVRKPPRR